MTSDVIGVITLNDGNLSLTVAGQSWQTSGFATLTDKGALFGEQAQQQARLQPLVSFNQFWNQLSLEPIDNGSAKFRHYGDFAYHQLLDLHDLHHSQEPHDLHDPQERQTGHCDKVILAVPASFDREQLSLLLGIFQRSPWQVVGLIDSALAALAGQADRVDRVDKTDKADNLLYLDIQLHQCLLTELNAAAQMTVKGSDIVTGTGLINLYQHWAKYLADQFIQQCRFDPLHDAKTEQQLYDLLPQLLNAAADDLQLSLQGKRVKLNRQSLQRHSLDLFAPLLKAISRHRPTDRLFISQRVAAIPEICGQLNNPITVADGAIAQNCLNFKQHICNQAGQIRFIASLPISDHRPPAAVDKFTHLLLHQKGLNNDAYPIGDKAIYISTDGGIGLSTAPQAKAQAQFSLIPSHHTLVLNQLNGSEILINDNQARNGEHLSNGDTLSFNHIAGSLTLINVIGDKDW